MTQTNYSIVFNHVENVLLNLGKELNKFNIAYMKHENVELIEFSIITVLRRLDFLEGILRDVGSIYEKSDNETKLIIKYLYMENKNFTDASNDIGISYKRIHIKHNSIVDAVMVLTGLIGENESKAKKVKREAIPTKVKEEIFKRDAGRCVRCSSDYNLHIHHIVRRSEGGSNLSSNLQLLCASCHAEEHVNEKSYYLLKSMAEKISLN